MPPRKDGKHFETHRFRTEAGWRDVEIRHDGTNFFATLAGRRYSHPGIQPLREELEQAQRAADLVEYKLYIELEFLEPFDHYGVSSKNKPFLGFVYHVSYLSEVIEVNGKKDRYRLKKEADGNYTDGYHQGEPWRRRGTHHNVRGTLIEWTAEREAVLHASQQALVTMREKLEALFKGNMEEIGRRLDGMPEQKLLGPETWTCRLCGEKADPEAVCTVCTVCSGDNCGRQDCWVGKHCKDCSCGQPECPSNDCRR